MRKYICRFFIVKNVSLLLLLLFLGCSSTHPVRTIGKNKGALEITAGGPMMKNLGPTLPIPNFFIGGRYGVRSDLDISVHYNLTTPVVPGIALDLITSAHWIPIQPGLRRQIDNNQKGWGVGGSLHLQWVTDFDNGFLFLPTLELVSGYRIKCFNPYLGLSLGLNFYRPDDRISMLQLHPAIGTEFIIRDRLGLDIKCTFYDVAYNFYGSQIDWIYIVNNTSDKKKYGVVGLSIGFSYDFGKKKNNKKVVNEIK